MIPMIRLWLRQPLNGRPLGPCRNSSEYLRVLNEGPLTVVVVSDNLFADGALSTSELHDETITRCINGSSS